MSTVQLGMLVFWTAGFMRQSKGHQPNQAMRLVGKFGKEEDSAVTGGSPINSISQTLLCMLRGIT